MFKRLFLVVVVLFWCGAAQLEGSDSLPITPLFSFGGCGSGDGEFHVGNGVEFLTVDPSGFVFVSDRDNHRIQKFDLEGNFVTKWGLHGTAEGQLFAPNGVGIAPDGSVYVADALNHRVQKFNENLEFVLMWGWGVSTGANVAEVCTENCLAGIQSGYNARGGFTVPQGIAVSSDGTVYVADSAHRVQKFDSQGVYLGRLGEGNPGAFYYPVGIAIDAADNVFVNEPHSGVEKWSSTDEFLTRWGVNGQGAGEVDRPQGVAVDQEGNVWLGDTDNHRVQMFDNEGVFRLMFGWGVSSGAYDFEVCEDSCQIGIAGDLVYPEGLGLDLQNRLYVADNNTCGVDVFRTVGPAVTCAGFEPPMASGPVTVRGNRALPFKAQLFDGDGYLMTDLDLTAPPVIQVWYEYGTPAADDVTDEALPAGQSSEGNQFFFDSDQRWHFNLKTKSYSASGTYTVFMDSGDASEYLVDPTCTGQFVVK